MWYVKFVHRISGEEKFEKVQCHKHLAQLQDEYAKRKYGLYFYINEEGKHTCRVA